jgi:hypothetical protein
VNDCWRGAYREEKVFKRERRRSAANKVVLVVAATIGSNFCVLSMFRKAMFRSLRRALVGAVLIASGILSARSALAQASACTLSAPTQKPTVHNQPGDRLKEKELALDVTLDKKIYNVGEKIPIHITLKNINASESMTSGPCNPTITTVRDVDGQRIRPSGTEVCVTTATVCGVLARGQIAKFERTFDDIVQPGVYTVTGFWPAYIIHQPCTGLISVETDKPPEYPYAYVHSAPVTIRITDREHPDRGRFAPSAPWPANFVQVSTSFGPETALLDRSTGLKWLHIDLTEQKSYLAVKQEMATGAPLEGWRYATEAEVKKLSADFYGPNYPNMNDPKIEAVFQGAFIGYSIFGNIPGAPVNGECIVMGAKHVLIAGRWDTDLDLTPMCSYLVKSDEQSSR